MALPSASPAPVQQATNAVGGVVTSTGQTAGQVVAGATQTVSGALPTPVSSAVSNVGQTAGNVVTGVSATLGGTVTSLGNAPGG